MHGMWWYPRIHGSCGLMYCCITYYAVLRTTVLGATTTYTITVMVYVYGWLMVSVRTLRNAIPLGHDPWMSGWGPCMMYSLPAHVVPWYCLARHVMYSLYLHTYTITVMVCTYGATGNHYGLRMLVDPWIHGAPMSCGIILLLVSTCHACRPWCSVSLTTTVHAYGLP